MKKNTSKLDSSNVEIKYERYPDMNETIKQKWELGQERLKNKELCTIRAYVNGTLYDIIAAYAKATKRSISRTMCDLIWGGIFLKDEERQKNDKKSIRELANKYEKASSEARIKALQKEIELSKIKTIEKVFK